MLIDAALEARIDRTAEQSLALEAHGYDGIWVSETQHDPFLHLLQVAEATSRVTVGTAIAIALGRTPLTVAHAGHDVAYYSQGRFVLGLGSQVKPHIERRFSMSWSHPAARMREFVLALRAIWRSWQTGEKLDFKGNFYTHTLMSPFFSPGQHDFGPPPVYLAGVGALMTEVAGEVCDGFFLHPFTTRSYFDAVTRPALLRGRATAGHEDLKGLSLCGPAFVVTGRDQGELATAKKGTKQQIAFYASTPAYRGVLAHHGREDLQPELTRLTKEGKWDQLGDAVDDDLLDLFAVTGDPTSAGRRLVDRWGDVYDRVSLDTPYPVDPSVAVEVMDGARSRAEGT